MDRRRAYYIGLGGTWVFLACLIAGSGSRGGTVDTTQRTWWNYALAQFNAIVKGLRPDR